jgi:hypothetical protein
MVGMLGCEGSIVLPCQRERDWGWSRAIAILAIRRYLNAFLFIFVFDSFVARNPLKKDD